MASTPTVAFILGTRPEVIKLAPVIRECQHRDIDFVQIHTGQHYSRELDDVFFEQLNLPTPKYNLEVGSQSHGKQTGVMLGGIESILLEEQPEVVLVQGDTNSVLAGAIAGSKIADITVGHVESGLRSFDQSMPEETNRRLTDHASDHLFAPTPTALDNLQEENISANQITVTGNTIVDAVKQQVEIAHQRSTVFSKLDIDGTYALLTAHRAENVDDQERFSSLLSGVARCASEYDLPIYYPIHPRAQNRLEEFDITIPNEITVVDPQDFLDFLVLEDDACLVFTDSGGVQEETCILGTRCVTLRDNTERPETVDVGANCVVGVNPDDIMTGAERMLARDTNWENPFGDGTAATQIVDIVKDIHE